MNKNTFSIGEAQFNNEQNQVMMECSSEYASELTLIVLDVLGRPILEKKMTIGAGSSIISFNISSYKAGVYNVWIYHQDGMILRQFKVYPIIKETRNLIRACLGFGA